MIRDRKYVLDAQVIEVPEASSANDFIFNTNSSVMVLTNHNEEIVVMRRQGGGLICDVGYDAMKFGLRTNHAGRTVFPVVVNKRARLTHFGVMSVEDTWLVATYLPDKTYFFGDGMQRGRDTAPDAMKAAKLAKIACVDENGEQMNLLVVVQEKHDEAWLQKVVQYRETTYFRVEGMEFQLGAKGFLERWLIATSVELEEEGYADIPEVVPYVRKVDDVVVWRDLIRGNAVPSTVEAYIITSAIFFSYEGYAALNLMIIGSPGSGKSFQLDCIGYLANAPCYNMEETTLKGLVFSHAKQGRLGILYRERFVALLNEFVRIIGQSRNAAVYDDARRLLSTLNDAVEKKRGRSRSSGNVEGSSAHMVCSLLSSDNDYPQTLGTFLKALLEDQSYMRRYALLRLSKETVAKGKATTRPADWRGHLDELLYRRGLGGGKWLRLMKFWRSQVPDALKAIPYARMEEMRNFVVEERDRYLVKLFFGEQASFALYEVAPVDTLPLLFLRLKEVDFTQLSTACLLSACIMGSTFRTQGVQMPVVVYDGRDMMIAKRMVQRLVGDMFELLRPYIMESGDMGGVLRFKTSFGGR